MFSQKVRNFIVKLQGLSDAQKKAILLIVVIIVGLPLGMLWLVSSGKIIKNVDEHTRIAGLPNIDLPVGEITGTLKNLGDEVESQIENADALLGLNTDQWQTYANSDYGFEVKYPNDATYQVNNNAFIRGSGNVLFDVDFSFVDESSQSVCASYDIYVENTKYSDINDWVKKEQKRIETPVNYESGTILHRKVDSVKDVLIGEELGKKMIIKGDMPDADSSFGILHNGKLYVMNSLDLSLAKDRSCVRGGALDYIYVFEQIFTTFAFTN